MAVDRKNEMFCLLNQQSIDLCKLIADFSFKIDYAEDSILQKFEDDEEAIKQLEYGNDMFPFGKTLVKNKFLSNINAFGSDQKIISTLASQRFITAGLQERIDYILEDSSTFTNTNFFIKILFIDTGFLQTKISGIQLQTIISLFFHKRSSFTPKRRLRKKRVKRGYIVIKAKFIKRKYFLHVSELYIIILFFLELNNLNLNIREVKAKSLVNWLKTYKMYVVL